MEAQERAMARVQIGVPLLGIVLAYAAATLLSLPWRALSGALPAEVTSSPWFGWLGRTAPFYCVAIPLALPFFRLAPKARPLGETKRYSPLFLLGFLALGFAVVYLGNFIGALAVFATGGRSTATIGAQAQVSPFLANLIFCGLIPPVMEELLFRKLVIDRLRGFGDTPAILLSALVFALMHGNLQQVFYAFGSGILFGYLYLRTGKLRYPILCHAAINCFGAVYTAELIRAVGNATPWGYAARFSDASNMGRALIVGYLLVLAAAAVGSVAFLLAMLIKRRKPILRRPTPPLCAGEWARILLLNPAVWLFLATAVLLFL